MCIIYIVFSPSPLFSMYRYNFIIKQNKPAFPAQSYKRPYMFMLHILYRYMRYTLVYMKWDDLDSVFDILIIIYCKIKIEIKENKNIKRKHFIKNNLSHKIVIHILLEKIIKTLLGTYN